MRSNSDICLRVCLGSPSPFNDIYRRAETPESHHKGTSQGRRWLEKLGVRSLNDSTRIRVLCYFLTLRLWALVLKDKGILVSWKVLFLSNISTTPRAHRSTWGMPWPLNPAHMYMPGFVSSTRPTCGKESAVYYINCVSKFGLECK